jgi:two-component system sensor histidine kinase YesM
MAAMAAMANALRRMARRLSGRSMRSKLFISFSIIIVTILTLVMALLNSFISSSYRERILHSASQSYDQAAAFFQNYINSMIYASDLIYYNGDLQRILTSNGFNGARDSAEQYREFLTLDKVFDSVEMSESVYRAKIYVPDDIRYANRALHFAMESQLEAREDYATFLAQSRSNKVFFTAPESVSVPGRVHPEDIISLLRPIKSTDGRAAPIAVEQISVLLSDLREVIDKSDITSAGLVCLVNERGEIISVSEHGRELLDMLRASGSLPASGARARWDAQTLAGQSYLVSSQQLSNAEWRLIALIPEREIREQSRQVQMIILSFTAVSVIMIFAVSYFLAKYYTKRLAQLAEMIRAVHHGDLDAKQEDGEGDEIGELSRAFISMTKRVNDLMEERYRTGKAVKTAQLQALQAQINPHFLYNTLDLINWEAMDHNAPEIAQVAQCLGDFYRISLNKGRQIVTIEEELRHAEAYAAIENRHFDGAIDLLVDVPEEIRKLSCINIILQPFVENAIVHNLAKDAAIQKCAIYIGGRLDGGDILLLVEDDGVGMTERQIEDLFAAGNSRLSRGYGVKNIHARIQLCYGKEYGLAYKARPGTGVRVEIRLPALTPEEAESQLDL